MAAMLYVAWATIEAYYQQSNLWPILMILASPIAVLVVAAILIAGLKIQVHPRRRMFTFLTAVIVAVTLAFEAYVFGAA